MIKTKQMIAAVLLAASTVQAVAPRGNLVRNPSFTEGNGVSIPGWEIVSGPWKIDPADGKRLECDLSIPSTNTRIIQEFDAVPGWCYDYSAMVKVDGLKGRKGSAATIALKFYDADGKLLEKDALHRSRSNENPYGNKGTTDWERVSGTSGPAPKRIQTARVILRVKNGMTGTCWFDNVEVKRHYLMSVVVTQPNYRGWIWADQKEIVYDVEFNPVDFSEILKGFRVDVQLSDPFGEGVASGSSAPSSLRSRASLALPKGLAPGKYRFEARLMDRSTGRVVNRYEKELIRQDAEFRPDCYIDTNSVLRVEGKPFFPLGLYYRTELINDGVLSNFQGTAFNVIMPYGKPDAADLDKVNEYGLKVIYDLKQLYFELDRAGIDTRAGERPLIEGYVNQYKNHPALLGWYLNDERPIGMVKRMETHYDWICGLDSEHPAWSAFFNPEHFNFRRMVDVSDAFGVDPYPVPHRSLAQVSKWVQVVEGAFGGSRPLWTVVQLHTKPDERSITPEEIKAMTWQAITGNCKGIVYYAFHWLHPESRKRMTQWKLGETELDPPFEVQWEWVCSIAAEVDRWKNVILSEEVAPQVSVAGEDVTSICKSLDGKHYLFVVNPEYSPRKIVIGSESAPVAIDPKFAVSQTSENSYEVELSGLAVAIYSY